MIIATEQNKTQVLIALALFNLSLLGFRMIVTHSITYGFLIWNLILAAIPYFVCWYLSENEKYATSPKPLLLFSGLWLSFFPNAPYLITDFVHFKRTSGMPEWFDILLLMSFAWNGLWLAFLSLASMQNYWNQCFGTVRSWLLVFASGILAGVGIYIGRYLRFNSWDLIVNPLELLRELPMELLELRAIGFSIGYGIFLLLTYCCFTLNNNHNHEIFNLRKNV